MDCHSIIDDLIAENEILKAYIQDLGFQILMLQKTNECSKETMDQLIERTIK